MTIDEFMTDIAPKMRPGWVVMSKNLKFLEKIQEALGLVVSSESEEI